MRVLLRTRKRRTPRCLRLPVNGGKLPTLNLGSCKLASVQLDRWRHRLLRTKGCAAAASPPYPSDAGRLTRRRLPQIAMALLIGHGFIPSSDSYCLDACLQPLHTRGHHCLAYCVALNFHRTLYNGCQLIAAVGAFVGRSICQAHAPMPAQLTFRRALYCCADCAGP